MIELSTNLSRKDASFLDLATKVAQTSNVRRKHGAVLVKGSSVLSLAINTSRNNPKTFPVPATAYYASFHAELNCLRKIKPDGSVIGSTMYVASWRRDRPVMSRPCDLCFVELDKAGVRKIVFTI